MAVPKAKLTFLESFARPFLTTKSHEDLLDKEQFFEKQTFTKGYTIIKQGEVKEYIYIIQSGKVAVYTNTTDLEVGSENKVYLLLQKLKTGEVFNFNFNSKSH